MLERVRCYSGGMSDKRKFTPQSLSGVVLFVVILCVSIAIALLSDLNPFARGAIAVVCGVVAAAVSYVLLDRRQKKRRQ
jgi:drug/metabolite transporter (DMT)-like permease